MTFWDSFLTTFIGILMLIRSWKYYNYLLLEEKKNRVGIFKYISSDKNIFINAFLIIPIKGEA